MAVGWLWVSTLKTVWVISVLALEDAAEFIAGARTRIEARDFGAFEDGGVVGVGRDRTLRGHLVRAADHAEERFLALFTVDRPAGVEDLVTAVLGVGLREHHQLDVGRVAADLREGVGEVVDLVGERAQRPISTLARSRAGRPSSTRATVAIGRPSSSTKRFSAGKSRATTDSVMRS